jgi:chaperonin GroEL
MYPKQISFGDDARAKLLAGIRILMNAVSTTLGPGGRNVFIDTGQGTTIITKDGVTVARHVNVIDEVENMAIQTIKESAAKLLEKDGDGTTSVTVLTCSLIDACFEMLSKNPSLNVTQMALGIEKAAEAIITEIEKLGVECTDDLLERVCKVSSNYNESVYKYVIEAFKLAGKEGSVVASLGKHPQTTVQKIHGYKITAGYSDPVFASMANDSGTIRWTDVQVILCGDSVSYVRNLVPILSKIVDQFPSGNRPKILLISKGLMGEALAFVVQNVMQSKLDLVHIQAPYYLTDQASVIDDIASISGAIPVGEDRYGSSLDNATLDNVGFLPYVEIRSNVALFKSEKRNPQYIEKVKLQLEAAIEQNNADQITFIRQRLNMLAGQMVSIEIGGEVAVDQLERNDLFDDAIRACESARKYGVVPGGSVSLVRAMYKVQMNEAFSKGESFQTGFDLMLDMCLMPMNYILRNMGINLKDEKDERVILFKDFMKSLREGTGFRTGQEGSVFYHFSGDDLEITETPTIYDPVNVVKNSVKYSSIVAKSIITTDCTINMIRVQQ